MFGKKGVEGTSWFMVLFVLALLIFASIMVFPFLLKKTAHQLFEANIFSDLQQRSDDSLIVVSTSPAIDQEAVAPGTLFVFRPAPGEGIPNPSVMFEKQATGKKWSLSYFYFCDLKTVDYIVSGIPKMESEVNICSKGISQDDLDYLLSQPTVQGTLILGELSFTRGGKSFGDEYLDHEGNHLSPKELAEIITKHFYSKELEETT